jgi:O-antigen ligase
MTYDFWLTVLGFLPFGAVTSQSLLDLMICILAIGLIYRFSKNKDLEAKKMQWLGIEWAIIGYFAVILLGYAFNASKDAEIAWNLKKFMWVFNLYLFIYVFKNVTLQRQKLIWYFTYVFLIPNLYGLVSYFIGYDMMTKEISERIVGLVNSATYHAHGNALIFVFFSACFYFSFKKLTTKQKVFTSLAYLLLGLSILLTFTRGIWLSIFISTILMYALISWRISLNIVLVTFVIGATSFFTWPRFNERVHHSLSANRNEERENLLIANFKMWKEYPLLGIGYGENQRRNREYWDRMEMPDDYLISHAHNQFINVMTTTGVCGLFFFLYIFSFFLKKNWFLLRATSRKLTPFRFTILFACLWAQVEFILACITDVSFEYAKIRSLILLVWALVLAIETKPEILKEEINEL